MSCPELEVSSPIMVDAQIHRWTITNDNIYLLKFQEEPPQWFEDIVNEIIDDTGLVGDVGDLENRFADFEEGYSEHFYDWKDGDTETLAYVETIYTTNGEFNAGLQDIKIAYVKKDEAGAYFDQLIGAWQTGGGGAWFNERVSVVSNVAYSSAKSVSTLTATLGGQQEQLKVLRGDIETLESQVDGKVVTWKGYASPVIGDQFSGDINPAIKPYLCWLPGEICEEEQYNDDNTLDTRLDHTGDTYLYVEVDAATGKDKLLSVYRFVAEEQEDGTYNYAWVILENDLASEAYQAALDAAILADSKINSYLQETPPTLIEDPTLGEGDLWTDSTDGFNILYRYNGTSWELVRDTGITSSIDRLDQATVGVLTLNPLWENDGVGNPDLNPNWYEDDLASDPDYLGQPKYIYGSDPDTNGESKWTTQARALSSLNVKADGNVAGYYIGANSSTSIFKIYADKFQLSASNGQPAAYAPFTVNTVDGRINFNGIVSFKNIRDEGSEPSWLFAGDAAEDINKHTTTISGGKIQTYSLNANRIAVDTLWARGIIASESQRNNNTGYISDTSPAGFILNGKQDTGSYNYPNIYGSYIRGGTIAASKITFNGAKWESTCGDSHTGNTGYTDSGDYNFSTGGNINYILPIGLVSGPCYNSGHRVDRVLSRATSRILLTASASLYLESENSGSLQLMYRINGGGWVTTGLKHSFFTGTGAAGSAHPSISFSFNIGTVPNDGYIQFGVNLIANNVVHYTWLQPNVNGSIILNN